MSGQSRREFLRAVGCLAACTQGLMVLPGCNGANRKASRHQVRRQSKVIFS